MPRIAKHVADRIAQLAIEDAQKERREANTKRWQAASEKAYDALVPKKVREILVQVPNGWLHMVKDARVRGSNGYMLELQFKDRKAVPDEWRGYSNKAILKDEKLTAELMACDDERRTLGEDAAKMYRTISTNIQASNTWKKLELAWPEGRAYYAAYMNAENKTGTSLVVEFSSVNKVLGLPKDKAITHAGS